MDEVRREASAITELQSLKAPSEPLSSPLFIAWHTGKSQITCIQTMFYHLLDL